jgi:exodeoxyribonuclease VII small subunit
MTFEQAIARLDEIVALLGDGKTTLSQSLELFADGSRLVEQCTKELEAAKLTIETLTADTNAKEV